MTTLYRLPKSFKFQRVKIFKRGIFKDLCGKIKESQINPTGSLLVRIERNTCGFTIRNWNPMEHFTTYRGADFRIRIDRYDDHVTMNCVCKRDSGIDAGLGIIEYRRL